MMQTQRTILWVIFVMSLLFLWDSWQKHNGRQSLFGGPPPSSQSAPGAGGLPAQPGQSSGAGDATIPSAPTAPASGAAGQAGQPVASAPASVAATGRLIRMQNDVMLMDVDTMGGQIRRVELLKHREESNRKDSGNLLMLSSEPGRVFLAQTGLVGAEGLPNHNVPMTVVSQAPDAAAPAGTAELVMASEGGGARVERRYRLLPGSYEIQVETRVANQSEKPLSPTLYMQLTRDGNPAPGASGMYSTYTGPVVYTEAEKFQKVDFTEIEKGKAKHSARGDNGWVGIIQHYFATAWVPKQGVQREYYTRRIENNLYSVGALEPLGQIAPGQTVTNEATLFVGPQDHQILERVAPGLELVRDYGWLTAIAKPLFWLLEALHQIVGNWGWAIVLLTILVKLAFFPLQAASYRSMAKMKKVTPKLTALRERYGSDRVKMNQAMMELYKTEKINPLGGCLPIVVQIPVFIALYWVLLASVEIRNAPWIGWIQDLSTPDPWFILPVIMAATMFVQTRLNPTPPDPLQAKMMLWMPLIFSVMFFFFPAGLVLYWVVSNLFSIAQQWVITRRIEGKPVFGRAQ
ncbi:MAG TPA: membrane protein insertase YidC [Lautropia sp.]|nr:membrane protein insertase YidC [Lautropia sp.]